INITNSADDFQIINIYKQMIAQYHKTGVLKNVAFRSMSKVLTIAIQKGGRLKQYAEDKFSGDVRQEIISDYKVLDKYLVDNPSVLDRIIALARDYYFLLEDAVPVNDKLLLTLWTAYSGTGDWRAARAALDATAGATFSNYCVTNSNEAFSAIRELNALRRWLYTDYVTIILIDHLERIENNVSSFDSLFSLLNSFRTEEHTCFILSGIVDAYAQMDEAIGQDKIAQIHNWEIPIAPLQLPNEQVIDIVNRHLSNFWKRTNEQPPSQHALFPFSANSISYLYDTNERDLRKTLIQLHDLIESYRDKGALQTIPDFFTAMRLLRTSRDYKLTPFEQKELIEKILDPSVQDLVRSKNLEKKIKEFLEIAMEHEDYDDISNVKHEPPIGPAGEKPDVYFELFGAEGAEGIRRVAIEVKVYRKGSEVPPEEIKKTHVLLTAKKVDIIHWVTNKPLHVIAKTIPTGLESNVTRTKPLSNIELAYAALVLYYEEIFGSKPAPNVAIQVLKKMGIDLDFIIQRAQQIQQVAILPAPLVGPMPGSLEQFVLNAGADTVRGPITAQATPSFSPPSSQSSKDLSPVTTCTPGPESEPAPKKPSKKGSKKPRKVSPSAPSAMELSDDDLAAKISDGLVRYAKEGRMYLPSSSIHLFLSNISVNPENMSDEQKNRIWTLMCQQAVKNNFQFTASRIKFK
ncbi:MAG: hypothetical protein Q6353_009595, partial [Candidatus Sigynarchaeum springense]